MNVGIDLVEHKDIIDKDERFIRYILSNLEYNYYRNIQNDKRKVEYVASRFACKEAVIKCLEKRINFQEISILNKENGAPYIQINEQISKLQISLSHTDSYSVAIVINPLINHGDYA